MKKLAGILMIATIAFSSCNTSKYYFKMRGFGKAKKPIEKVMEDPEELSSNNEITKDTISLSSNEEKKEIVTEEITSAVNPENISSQKEIIFQPVKEKRIQSLKPELEKNRISQPVSQNENKLRQSTQEKKQRSSFDWEEFFEISMDILISLILIAAGLAMEGTLTWATFLTAVLGAVIGAILFGFLLWLLFHNFVDGIRESRSRR